MRFVAGRRTCDGAAGIVAAAPFATQVADSSQQGVSGIPLGFQEEGASAASKSKVSQVIGQVRTPTRCPMTITENTGAQVLV